MINSPRAPFINIVEKYKKPNMKIAEVGVYDGSSTLFICPL